MEGLRESLMPLFEEGFFNASSGQKTRVGILVFAGSVAAVTVFSWYAFSWTSSPLRHVPGPFLAGWSNLWRLLAIWSDRYPLTMQKLHKKYGLLVRIRPDTVTLDFPELIRTIYGTDGKFRKTGFCASASAVVDGKLLYTLFGEPNPDRHAQSRRPMAKHYTMGAALGVEPHMDHAIPELCAQLDRLFVSTDKACDMWQWSLYLIWDLSSHIIFSRRFGYLEHACDFDGSIGLSATIDSYFQTVGRMTWLDFWLDKNPVIKIGPGSFTSLMKLAAEGYAARLAGADSEGGNVPQDYLQHFIELKNLRPETVDDGAVVAYTMQHIIAGANTTAILISAIIHFVLAYPEVHAKVVAEVRAAGLDKDLSVPFNVARQLPYLDAIWREGTRLQPIAGSRMLFLV